MPRVRVKICGVTRRQDAEAAAALGADAIGLNFFAKSPRKVQINEALAITKGLPPFLCRVGLFVNTLKETILEAAATIPLDVVQLQGDESPDFCADLAPLKVIKAIRVGKTEDLESARSYCNVASILFDAKVPGVRGGTGETFPWEWLRDWADPVPFILAGGLSPQNVREAITLSRPLAVDVSSGVEDRPGAKSTEKMTSFMAAVSEADR